MNDALIEVPEFPPGAKGVLWENWPLDKVCMQVLCKLGGESTNCTLFHECMQQYMYVALLNVC